MSVTIEKLGGENIVIAHHTPPYVMPDDGLYLQSELEKLLAETSDSLHVIVDLSRIQMNFSELVQGMSMSSSRTSEASMKSGRITMSLVASGEWMEKAAEAFQQQQYGGQMVHLFATLEEALAHAQA